jgi:hypothetical protein
LSTLTQEHRVVGDFARIKVFQVYRRTIGASFLDGCGQRREFLTSKGRASNAPATFRCLGQKHPRTLGLRRVSADISHDGCRVFNQLLLTVPGECAGRRDDLNANGPCERLGRRLNGRGSIRWMNAAVLSR